MKKIIPQQIDIYCDRCGVICNERKHKASLIRNARFKDYMWEWHEVPNESYDLCDECFIEFDKFINKYKVKTKE